MPTILDTHTTTMDSIDDTPNLMITYTHDAVADCVSNTNSSVTNIVSTNDAVSVTKQVLTVSMVIHSNYYNGKHLNKKDVVYNIHRKRIIFIGNCDLKRYDKEAYLEGFLKRIFAKEMIYMTVLA